MDECNGAESYLLSAHVSGPWLWYDQASLDLSWGAQCNGISLRLLTFRHDRVCILLNYHPLQRPSAIAFACLLARIVDCYASNVPVETCSLKETYKAALAEAGNLVAVKGRDGESRSSIDSSMFTHKNYDGAFVSMGICKCLSNCVWKIASITFWIESSGSFFYDSTGTTAADVIRNYDELLLSKWRGKLVVTQPNDHNSICYLF